MDNLKFVSAAQLSVLALQVRDLVLTEVMPQLAGISASLNKQEASAPVKARRKGFGLVKRESKKYGFLYYVRYWHDGRILPTKWCTHTNDRDDAEDFALKNRAYLINKYLERQDKIYFFRIFSDYFKKDSEYYKNEMRRNRKLSDHHRQVYDNTINNYFIPYLKGKKINALEKIDAEQICLFQDYLLEKGLKPQTINDYLCGIKKVFTYLCSKGKLSNNPFNNVSSLVVADSDKKVVGCHDVEKMKSVFSAEWGDKFSYLLCLLIYSTGLRDIEIENLRVEDIINIEDCAFLNIKRSKTRNGVRLVPLHNFVKTRLEKYIKENKRDGYIFTRNGNHLQSYVYRDANLELAKKINVAESELILNSQRINYLDLQKFKNIRAFFVQLLNYNLPVVYFAHKVVR
jgi:site-specific recombinase XerD